MKQKLFLIHYSNGFFETTDSLNITLLHLVEIGVIDIIFNCADNIAYVGAKDQNHKEVNIPHVSGLN